MRSSRLKLTRYLPTSVDARHGDRERRFSAGTERRMIPRPRVRCATNPPSGAKSSDDRGELVDRQRPAGGLRTTPRTVEPIAVALVSERDELERQGAGGAAAAVAVRSKARAAERTVRLPGPRAPSRAPNRRARRRRSASGGRAAADGRRRDERRRGVNLGRQRGDARVRSAPLVARACATRPRS